MPKGRELSQRELALQEKLNIPGLGPFEEVGRGLPPIERAPMFRKQTPLIGMGTYEANELEKLYRLAPQLRGRAESITSGYGPMYLETIMKEANQSKLPNRVKNLTRLLDSPEPISIGGYTGMGQNKGQVEIGPTNVPESVIGTLAHEMGHVTGLRQAEKLKKNGFWGSLMSHPVVEWGLDEEEGVPGFGTYQTGALAGKNYYPLKYNKDVNLPNESEGDKLAAIKFNHTPSFKTLEKAHKK